MTTLNPPWGELVLHRAAVERGESVPKLLPASGVEELEWLRRGSVRRQEQQDRVAASGARRKGMDTTLA